jgi:hypothetical protein
MACPSLKELLNASGSDSRGDEPVRRHLRDCAACRAQLDEQARAEAFFRRNFQPPEPSPFLWTRIESRLGEPVRPRRAFTLWNLAPARLLASAALLLLVAAAVVTWSNAPVWFGPSQATILSHIDREYERTLLELQNADPNPFDGREILETAEDENPFQAMPPEHLAGPAEENPFRAALNKEYKN